MTDCIFCKIVAGDIPSDKVYEDDHVLAFKDIQPKAPVHLLVITKKHIDSLDDLTTGDSDLIAHTLLKIKDIAQDAGLTDGYRTITNTGAGGGQEVPHLHFHILGGGRPLPGF